MVWEAPAIQRCSVKNTAAETRSAPPVMTLEETGGFSFARRSGMSVMQKKTSVAVRT